MKRFRIPILLSALIIFLAVPPWSFWPLIWVSLVGWFYELDRPKITTRHRVLQSLLLGVLMSMLCFPWVAYAIKNFGQIPWVISIFIWILFAFINEPQFFFFALLYKKIPRNPLAFALVYTALDFAIPKLFHDTMGHSLFLATNLRQAASLGGAPLLTFVIIFVNAWLGLALSDFVKARSSSWLPVLKRSLRWAVITLLIFSALQFYGKKEREKLQALADQASQSVRFAGIQANIGDFDKVAAESGLLHAGEKIMDAYFRLSEQALAQTPKPDILVWPETAYPSNFRSPSNPMQLFRDQRLESWVQNHSVPLFFGGYDEVNNLDYNSLFMLYPAPLNSSVLSSDLQVYHKAVLLPFGEYIPGFGRDSIFKQLFPAMGFFGTGPGAQVFDAQTAGGKGPSIKISPLICYEALFPDFTMEGLKKGSQLILNLTNDSWFGSYGEPELHLILTTFRSLETRLPQLRVTNTGISTYIKPDGEITEATGIQKEGLVSAQVPVVKPPPTLLVRWGVSWFPITCLILAFFWIFLWPFLRPFLWKVLTRSSFQPTKN